MTDISREQMLERIAELERMQRCVQLLGYGYLLNHGGKQIALDPKDVTVVLPSTRHMDDFDLHNSLYLAEQQVQVLQDRLSKVREIAAGVDKYDEESRLDLAREVLAVLDGVPETLATGGVITKPIPIGTAGCVIDAWKETR